MGEAVNQWLHLWFSGKVMAKAAPERRLTGRPWPRWHTALVTSRFDPPRWGKFPATGRLPAAGSRVSDTLS
jgi:hypothetical protein